MYGQTLRSQSFDLDTLGAGQFLQIILLLTLGSLIHEFGHASAAARYGCEKLNIGLGVYLYFVVFYTELSEAWALPRRHRAIIDLGGFYFQSLYLGVLSVLGMATGSPIYLYAFLLTEAALATCLNPFFRMDGYWLLSDLFGILDLRRATGHTLKRFLGPLLGRKTAPSHLQSSLRRGSNFVVLVYLCTSVLFFAYVSHAVFRLLLVDLFYGYPVHVQSFLATVWHWPLDISAIGAQAIGVFWRTAALVGLLITFARLTKHATKCLRSTSPQRQSRQGAGSRCTVMKR